MTKAISERSGVTFRRAVAEQSNNMSKSLEILLQPCCFLGGESQNLVWWISHCVIIECQAALERNLVLTIDLLDG